MDEKWTSMQVQQLTGLSARQLQWWDERGIVKPAREGHRRLYSLEDLAEIAVICELRRRGFSLQRIRKVIRYLQRELKRRLVETVSNGAEYHLLTDGRSIFLEDTDRGVVDVLRNARQPMLAICISDAVQRVRAELNPANSVQRAPRDIATISRTHSDEGGTSKTGTASNNANRPVKPPRSSRPSAAVGERTWKGGRA
ncbi:MAG TPA: MerR family transcriptional regulator [Terriglobales bacterium]